MKRQILFYTAALFSLLVSCQQAKQQENTASADSASAAVPTIGSPTLLYTLPDKYNTPDGLALAPDGSVYLSVPNLANNDYPGVLLKFAGDSLQFFTSLPAQPQTKHACPMDMAFGPDGNLYYAENQYENDKDYKSRLMRITMQDGKPVRIEPVVVNLALGNAVVWKGNTIYVTDSQWDMPDNDKGSAVFHFTLNEMNKGLIQLKPKTMDPHILATFTTQVNETGVDNGADGLDYDSKGNFYTGSFGDGTLYKLTLKPDGSLASNEKMKLSQPISCVDGLIVDRKTDKLYICNSRTNAILTVTSDGKVSTLAQNGDTDGADGRLDQPAEVLLKGNRLYISNYDNPEKHFVNTKADKVHTMSYIDLPR
ncbi:SMP-30/gluconolactonase/LRE family protein [Spirosoma sp. KUDC1026]|uniref:SMP-30/gluconolactonase/LRE family protein n=1 Tax=Spirosoma sp. KUDC1026 TaxID=2745947 RepID=UPI00159BDC7F|nr:SMP-30/gluconolactonase/LRE family protein [Spirosoma sp. KUDC1026]QKZ12062.1 SMP-30/gluconolactonase/LRE family protein [Spirosoma sp. KUDC1026]